MTNVAGGIVNEAIEKGIDAAELDELLKEAIRYEVEDKFIQQAYNLDREIKRSEIESALLQEAYDSDGEIKRSEIELALLQEAYDSEGDDDGVELDYRLDSEIQEIKSVSKELESNPFDKNIKIKGLHVLKRQLDRSKRTTLNPTQSPNEKVLGEALQKFKNQIATMQIRDDMILEEINTVSQYLFAPRIAEKFADEVIRDVLDRTWVAEEVSKASIEKGIKKHIDDLNAQIIQARDDLLEETIIELSRDVPARVLTKEALDKAIETVINDTLTSAIVPEEVSKASIEEGIKKFDEDRRMRLKRRLEDVDVDAKKQRPWYDW